MDGRLPQSKIICAPWQEPSFESDLYYGIVGKQADLSPDAKRLPTHGHPQ